MLTAAASMATAETLTKCAKSLPLAALYHNNYLLSSIEVMIQLIFHERWATLVGMTGKKN